MLRGADTEQYTSFVNVDDFEYGVTGGKWLVEAIGYKGNVVGISGIAGLSTAEDRWRGAMSVFEKYPGIKVVAHEYCDWTYVKAKMAMESLIPAHPQIDGIWTGAGMMARGAIEALLAAGRSVPPITADDDTKETLDDFVRPDLPDTMFCNTHLPEEVIKRLFPGE